MIETYIAAGVPLFPCCPSDKSPFTKNGFKNATSDPDQISHWWNQWPDAVPGMPTGEITMTSVIDVDSGKRNDPDPQKRAQGESAFRWAKANEKLFDKAFIYQTQSGGFHVFCRYSSGDSSGRNVYAPGVDVRADGGYVIRWDLVGLRVVREAVPEAWPFLPPTEAKRLYFNGRVKRHEASFEPAHRDRFAAELDALLSGQDGMHDRLLALSYMLAFNGGLDEYSIEYLLRVFLDIARIDPVRRHRHLRTIDHIARHFTAIRDAELEAKSLPVLREREALRTIAHALQFLGPEARAFLARKIGEEQ
jgi:hypothetical protein